MLALLYNFTNVYQGSKIALFRSYLQVPQAAGQVKKNDISNENLIFSHMPIIFLMQGKCLI